MSGLRLHSESTNIYILGKKTINYVTEQIRASWPGGEVGVQTVDGEAWRREGGRAMAGCQLPQVHILGQKGGSHVPEAAYLNVCTHMHTHATPNASLLCVTSVC